MMGSGGFADAKAAARKAGVPEDQSDDVALQNMASPAALGSTPVGWMLDSVPPVLRNSFLNYVGRAAVHAAGGAGQFAAMQVGSNIAASQFDPNQNLLEGIPESAERGHGGVLEVSRRCSRTCAPR